MKHCLTIAGSDSCGGAGIQADLKTFSALGAYGCSVITALVAQNTRGVQSVYRIEPDFVAAQLDSVFSDVRIDTTKIGMLAETDIVEAVAERLRRHRVQNVVLDTVMLAKSGDPLLSPSAVETLRTRLLPQVSIITPNLPEAAALAAAKAWAFLDHRDYLLPDDLQAVFPSVTEHRMRSGPSRPGSQQSLSHKLLALVDPVL